MWISENEKRINLARLVVIALLVTLFSIWKLNGVVNWSWFLVFSPVWIALLILFICAVVIMLFNDEKDFENLYY